MHNDEYRGKQQIHQPMAWPPPGRGFQVIGISSFRACILVLKHWLAVAQYLTQKVVIPLCSHDFILYFPE
jgi:hypothetical protein